MLCCHNILSICILPNTHATYLTTYSGLFLIHVNANGDGALSALKTLYDTGLLNLRKEMSGKERDGGEMEMTLTAA